MAGFLKKAQVYLGLGPDDEYDEYDEPDERDERLPPQREGREPGPARSASPVRSAPVSGVREPAARGGPPRAREAVRPRPAPDLSSADLGEGSVVRTLPKERIVESAPPPPKSKSGVRAMPSGNAKPVVVSPTTFNSAQEVADKFKSSQPVIVNLQGVDKDLSRRLLDFCSGICYALSGHMERVATRVYLLTPADVEVSPEDRRRLTERGLAG
jgi:cell division inhibitor SepF